MKINLRLIALLVLFVFQYSVLFTHPAFSADRESDEETYEKPSTVRDDVKKNQALQELVPIHTRQDADESETKIIPLFDLTALGTFSSVNNSGRTAGYDFNGIFSPVVQFDESHFLIPYYNGSFSEIRQIVDEEEGGRVTDIISDHNGSLEYKYIHSPEWTYRVSGLARFHMVKEKDYDWGDGLYDYWDAGGGASAEYFFKNDARVKNSLSFGGEIYHRTYPNYQSLISLATPTAPEENEKDYMAYRPVLKYKYKKRGFVATALYAPVYKDYDDKKIINSNGILGSDERDDWFHYIDTDITFFPEDCFFGYNLGTTTMINKSNQNFYDSRSTIGLGDDVYTSDYYSYYSFAVSPSLIMPFAVTDKKKLIMVLGYEYMLRNYDNRKVQTSAGAYTDQEQMDTSHKIKLQGSYPLTENISLVAFGNYTIAQSNQDFETFYRYQYNAIYAAGGVRIKY